MEKKEQEQKLQPVNHIIQTTVFDLWYESRMDI